MDHAVITVLVALGGLVAAGVRAVQSRAARVALATEVERWARAAAATVWHRAVRVAAVDLAPAFAAELARLTSWAGAALAPAHAKRAAVVAVETWLGLLTTAAPDVAERLVAKIDQADRVLQALERQLATGTVTLNAGR